MIWLYWDFITAKRLGQNTKGSRLEIRIHSTDTIQRFYRMKSKKVMVGEQRKTINTSTPIIAFRHLSPYGMSNRKKGGGQEILSLPDERMEPQLV
jgi:hypothetical protein